MKIGGLEQHLRNCPKLIVCTLDLLVPFQHTSLTQSKNPTIFSYCNLFIYIVLVCWSLSIPTIWISNRSMENKMSLLFGIQFLLYSISIMYVVWVWHCPPPQYTRENRKSCGKENWKLFHLMFFFFDFRCLWSSLHVYRNCVTYVIVMTYAAFLTQIIYFLLSHHFPSFRFFPVVCTPSCSSSMKIT